MCYRHRYFSGGNITAIKEGDFLLSNEYCQNNAGIARKKKDYFYVIGERNEMMSKEWLTAQECIGLPGFPGSVPAIRSRLNILSAGKEGIKRKRSKSKAWEYHISILPEYVRPYVVDSDPESVRNEASVWEAEPKEIWDMMFRLLTPEQQQQVTYLFGTKGIGAVLPSLFDNKSHY